LRDARPFDNHADEAAFKFLSEPIRSGLRNVGGGRTLGVEHNACREQRTIGKGSAIGDSTDANNRPRGRQTRSPKPPTPWSVP